MVDIRRETDRPWCWACGADERSRPEWWAGVFCIENAHIIGGPTRSSLQDCPEAVVLLCTVCHKLAHGETIRAGGERLPNLTKGNLVWLKRQFDPEHFRPDLYDAWAIGRAPQAAQPMPFFIHEYTRRRIPGWASRHEQ